MTEKLRILAVAFLLALLACPAVYAQGGNRRPVKHVHANIVDTIAGAPEEIALSLDTIPPYSELPVAAVADTTAVKSAYDVWEEQPITFNPDPTRAVWMSALCPGLGQVYNRRYWKIPIVIGGYLGLIYATSWNNGMLNDYTRAYRDIMDNDPSTNSYMDFFPPTTSESSLDKSWLTKVLQSRKNFYRRNRDLCIICMVGVYFLAMIDAYVDASLSHFDISPQLSMDVAPAIFRESRGDKPAFGLAWAITF